MLAGCHCPDGTEDCDLLPDMTASALIISQQHTETPGLITLSNATPNIGWGPMEIHGSNSCWCDTVNVPCNTVTCPDGSFPKQKLNQTIYHKNGNVITQPLARDLAGTFAIGAFGYITTGSIGGSPFGDTWQYDPATDTWLEYYALNKEASSRDGAVAFAIGNFG